MRLDQKLLEYAVGLRIGGPAAYLLAVVVAGTAVALRFLLNGYLGGAQFVTFYPAVLLSALVCGTGAALLTTLLCGLASWYWFLPPHDAFRIELPAHVVGLLLYVLFASLVAITVGDLRRAIIRRRDAERHQLILIQELQHRTRNLLGIVRGIARQTSASSSSLSEFDARYESRLSALGRVQGLISRSEAIDLERLVTSELLAHNAEADGQRVALAGPPVVLSARVAQSMALALHELATNAVKHGALGQERGRLLIIWDLEASGRSPVLKLDWIESGVHLPDDAEGRPGGFGRQLIEKALPYELRGKTRLAFGSDGVRCRLEVPLGDAAGGHI